MNKYTVNSLLFESLLNKYNTAMCIDLTKEDFYIQKSAPVIYGTESTFVIVTKETKETATILALYNETKNGHDLYNLASSLFKELKRQGVKSAFTSVPAHLTDVYSKAFGFKEVYKVLEKEL